MAETVRPLFRATYRVLILKVEEPTQPHEKVLAICLEQNLVGRGATPEEALDDLHGVVSESLAYEFSNPFPGYRPDPDPELATVFDSSARVTPQGDLVLRRTLLLFELGVLEKPSKHRQSRVTFEECPAWRDLTD